MPANMNYFFVLKKDQSILYVIKLTLRDSHLYNYYEAYLEKGDFQNVCHFFLMFTKLNLQKKLIYLRTV